MLPARLIEAAVLAHLPLLLPHFGLGIPIGIEFTSRGTRITLVSMPAPPVNSDAADDGDEENEGVDEEVETVDTPPPHPFSRIPDLFARLQNSFSSHSSLRREFSEQPPAARASPSASARPTPARATPARATPARAAAAMASVGSRSERSETPASAEHDEREEQARGKRRRTLDAEERDEDESQAAAEADDASVRRSTRLRRR